MIDIPAMMNGVMAEWAKERSGKMFTLGKLINVLEETNPSFSVVFDFDKTLSPGSFMSYRGYYVDLAIDTSHLKKTVREFLEQAKNCMGREFYGYKGGDYLMGEKTPLWVSEYGEASEIGVSELIQVDNKLVISTKTFKDK